MSYFIYPDNPERYDGPPVPYNRLDAMKHWKKHYENLLMLRFFLKGTTSARDKIQLQKEITKAERAIERWSHHPRFDRDESLKFAEHLKRMWTSGKAV
jgi:hypothetical protein